MSNIVGFCTVILFPIGIWFVLNWWMDGKLKKLSNFVDKKVNEFDEWESDLKKRERELVEKDEFLTRVEKQLHDIKTYRARFTVPAYVERDEYAIRNGLVDDICKQISKDRSITVHKTDDYLEMGTIYEIRLKVVDDKGGDICG